MIIGYLVKTLLDYTRWMFITPIMFFYLAIIFATWAVWQDISGSDFIFELFGKILAPLRKFEDQLDFKALIFYLYLIISAIGYIIELIIRKIFKRKFHWGIKKVFLLSFVFTSILYLAIILPLILKIPKVVNNDYAGMIYTFAFFFVVTQVVILISLSIIYALTIFSGIIDQTLSQKRL